MENIANMENKKIVQNSIKTPDGTKLISTHTHDFIEYKDKNGMIYAVDGGNSYLKRIVDRPDYEETSVYFEDDHELVREAFMWGTYGKSGNEPLKLVPLKDLESDHISNILNTQTHKEHIELMFITELKFREQNKLHLS